jgi:hypothetical protein
MKKHSVIITLIAAGLFGAASAAPLPSNSPGPHDSQRPEAGNSEKPEPRTAASPGPRCRYSSWNPEVYSFYGEKDVIVKKFATIPADLSDRRVFLQVTQGDSSADVKLYERENGTFTVTDWTTKKTSRLLTKIDEAIVANKGEHCVGEKVKLILRKDLGEGKVSTGFAVPDSAEEAFANPVHQASGDFIKTILIILC